jgi:endoglucanase
VLTPIADAYVESDLQANTNFGSVNPLLLKTGALVAFNREAYFKFDISSVSQIGSVKLRLFAALSSLGNGPIVTSVYSAADTSWSESTITWNNKPPRSASALGNISVTTTTYAWYEIDVTSQVRAEKSLGRAWLTLALYAPAVTDSRILVASREAPNSKPELVVRP